MLRASTPLRQRNSSAWSHIFRLASIKLDIDDVGIEELEDLVEIEFATETVLAMELFANVTKTASASINRATGLRGIISTGIFFFFQLRSLHLQRLPSLRG